MKNINTVLIANRGEIAIRIMRACHELGIKTIGIYSKEDIGTLHRQKADESYLIGEGKSATEAYLDIEGILALAKAKNVDAIHPGYGFLSENIEFARRCEEEGIIFIGPDVEHLNMFGNKTQARNTATAAGLQVIPGTADKISSVDDVYAFGEEHGYPIIVKAVSGGGGKGMRIVYEEQEVQDAYDRTKSEAIKSFGNDELYIEKYIDHPKHIEIQILGDNYGNIVHLYDRDCSVQRRHQKVVEVAPAYGLKDSIRERLFEKALQLMNYAEYINAGTVEFLVSGEDIYFIEVNPRIQVEHTVTEEVTGIDIVKTQILIADGESLFGETIGISSQEEIEINGYAIQSRITTEDPLNNFAPDTGKIIGYQSPGGTGLRLDAGDAFRGSVVSPHYDSLIVKITANGSTVKETISKMRRALDEMKVVGVKTNIMFLKNIIEHPKFYEGDYSTVFIQDYPELFDFIPHRNRGQKILKYVADVTVNGFPGIIDKSNKPAFDTREVPLVTEELKVSDKPTFKHILDKDGPEAVSKLVLENKNTLLTDTTLRDAHQSLLTTRLRTNDMLKIAPYMNATMKEYFSLEMWGGATFDVAYNFLRESPWKRLEELRELIPDIPFQMLLRASNAVGYKNYPDNVIEKFIKTSADKGIDVFRIFDSLNWLETMKLPIEEALKTGKMVEGALCYTGDILDPDRSKIYTLDYYVNLAKEIEAQGVHFLGIKDMSGLLKPEAAYVLIKALKEELNIPIHLHSHDTSGNAIPMYSRAIDAGVDIVDTANAALSGQNSQPDANALYYTRLGTDRTVDVNLAANDKMAEYWNKTRKYYAPFESDVQTAFTQVYNYEIPGGQYSNLHAQATSLGLGGNRFDEVLQMYQRVNYLLGDIVKVTPSSKVVGDMALFMVQNELDEESVIEKGRLLDFPESVVSFFQGEIGQPASGMNKELQEVVLKDRDYITDRPGNHLEPFDFEKAKAELVEIIPERDIDDKVLLSYAMYPKVYTDYLRFFEEYQNVQVVDTPTFFYGMDPNESVLVEIEEGKTLLIELTSVGPLKEGGNRSIYFDLNGLPHEIEVQDRNVEGTVMVRQKANKTNTKHIGAQMPGTIVKVFVEPGDKVKLNDPLIITEAMKMESSIQAPMEGIIKDVYVKEEEQVKGGDLLIEYE